jgi:hypothetical protein
MENVQTADPYAIVLADLKAQRDRIDQAISMLTALRSGGVPVAMATSGGPASPGGEIEETAGMYLGMSIPEAAKKLLASRKRTLTNAEIASALKAGGLVMTSADPQNTIGSVLTRSFKDVGDVVRVGRGTWGLKDWYPGRKFVVVTRGGKAGADGTVTEDANGASEEVGDAEAGEA